MLIPMTGETQMETLQPEDVAFFKEMLTQQLDELLAAAERTVGQLIQSDTQSADMLDQASLDNDRNYTLRIRDRESHLIKKIKTTLAKIQDGSFGICEECDGEIGLARLKARPVTAYCIHCKTRMEAFEKVSGF